MDKGPRIILREKDPEPSSFPSSSYISGYCFYNPLRDGPCNLEIVCAPDKCIDGHWLIWRAQRLWNGYTSPQEVIGITADREAINEKTYGLAKKLAEERAKKEIFGFYSDQQGVPFVDETLRARQNLS